MSVEVTRDETVDILAQGEQQAALCRPGGGSIDYPDGESLATGCPAGAQQREPARRIGDDGAPGALVQLANGKIFVWLIALAEHAAVEYKVAGKDDELFPQVLRRLLQGLENLDICPRGLWGRTAPDESDALDPGGGQGEQDPLPHGKSGEPAFNTEATLGDGADDQGCALGFHYARET